MVRQPDATLALLPEWMVRPEAADLEVRDTPSPDNSRRRWV
jgi:hypothetical protein